MQEDKLAKIRIQIKKEIASGKIKQEWKKGTEVIRFYKKAGSDTYDDSRRRPVWGGKFGNVVATAYGNADGATDRTTRLSWPDTGEDWDEVLLCEVVSYADYKRIVEELTNVNYAELDKVVLPELVKAEIIAVLGQHNQTKTIFEDWGLGEVIEYGRGMTMLFYGSPGTGKTWTATLIARATDRELAILTAAQIQSSEPGAANRNIIKAFKEATDKNQVLLLDEVDGLITARNDVGMIIGSEINTLLTEIEKFEGICILATNRADTLDEALERRLSLIIEFPNPNEEQRKAIWEKLIPAKLPLAKDVKIDELAKIELTGGQIKNVLLNAARFALSEQAKAVEMCHFNIAVNRIKKSKNLLGSRSRYSQHTRSDFTKQTQTDINRGTI